MGAGVVVSSKARVYNNAKVSDHARVYGDGIRKVYEQCPCF